MRWPWTRRAAEPPPQPATAATPAADPPAPPSPMGWAFLPPIQRTLAPPIAPVTRPVEFPGELSAWRSPAFTDSLSHAVVDTSSGGVIDGDGRGLGQPTNTTAHAPELTLLPPPRPTAVQRSVRPGAAAAEPATASGSDEVRPAPSLTRAPSAGMPLVQRAVVDDPTPDAGPGASAGAGPDPNPEPVEQNESVAPESFDSVEPPSTEAESPTTSADTAASVDQVVPPLGHGFGAVTGALGPGGPARDGATEPGRAPGSGSHAIAARAIGP